MNRLSSKNNFQPSDNVNVEGVVPCWLCGEALEIKTTKNGKKYTVCESCGAQCFIRRLAGIKKLAALVEHVRNTATKFEKYPASLFVFQEIVKEIEGLKGEITKLEGKENFFFPDRELNRARTALEKRVEFLVSELERLGKNPERGILCP